MYSSDATACLSLLKRSKDGEIYEEGEFSRTCLLIPDLAPHFRTTLFFLHFISPQPTPLYSFHIFLQPRRCLKLRTAHFRHSLEKHPRTCWFLAPESFRVPEPPTYRDLHHSVCLRNHFASFCRNFSSRRNARFFRESRPQAPSITASK